MLLAINQDECSRLFDMETLVGRKEQVQKQVKVYQRRIAHACNKLVKSKIFQERDLVLKTADHAMKSLHAPKFTPK